MKRFEVHVERLEGYALVRPVGEFDLASVEPVERALRQLEGTFSEIVIDLRGVEFLDSTGLRTLLAADARGRTDGFRLRIVKGPEPVQSVLALTGMDKHLALIDDPGELEADP